MPLHAHACKRAAVSFYVDGKRETLLRCNYVMRGVQVGPGEHTIQFRYRPPVKPFYVSLAAILSGLGIVGFLACTSRRVYYPGGEIGYNGGVRPSSGAAT
jgi:hypothetical protein